MTTLDPVAHTHTANGLKPPEAVLGALKRAAPAAGDADVGGRPRPQRRRAEAGHPYGHARGRVKPEEVCVRVLHIKPLFLLISFIYVLHFSVFFCHPTRCGMSMNGGTRKKGGGKGYATLFF